MYGIRNNPLMRLYEAVMKSSGVGGVCWCAFAPRYASLCIMYSVFSHFFFFSADRYCAVVLRIPEKNIPANCITCLYRSYKEHKIGKESLHHVKPFLILSPPIFCNNIKDTVMTSTRVVRSFIYNLTTAYIT